MNRPLQLVCAFVLAVAPVSLVAIESTAPAPNSNPAYLQLRHPKPAAEAYEVKNLKFDRDAGTFELQQGTLCLVQPVDGMTTGAIFKGTGTFSLSPLDPEEKHQMSMLTGQPAMKETFEKLVMRFSDATAEELTKSLTKSSGTCPSDLIDDHTKYLRTQMKWNLAERLLQPVLADKPDGFFSAWFQGNKYGKLLFVVDPTGVPELNLQPEEVGLVALDERKGGIWYGGHLLTEARNGARVVKTNHETGMVKPIAQKIDTTIEKNGFLSAVATTTVTSQVDNLRVLPLSLFSKLRVSSVQDASGSALAWIQEDKNEDADYAVVLAKPVMKGGQVTVTTTYSGKEVVRREGDGNYYPVVRSTWYPNPQHWAYSQYELTFRVPKNTTMAATGSMISQKVEGGQNVSVWKTDVPIAVAGFNFGDFKHEETTLQKQGVKVQAFANKEIPDVLKGVNDEQMLPGAPHAQEAALGNLSTTPMLKKALAEASLSVELYTAYFGPMSYKNLQVTQQTAASYGQAWPGLVFLPLPYFLDTTQRHSFHLDDPKGQYWTVVEPHEVAHEWWGHTLGWASYRDQWMSEGFADFSASLFIQLVRNDRGSYNQFWKDLRERMVQKDNMGFRPIDVGPVTMGYRLVTSKVGDYTPINVLYPKGAYILQMLRMMMWTPKTQDADFQAMMKDFVETSRNKAITTEDFKAAVERHMTPAMDVDGNRKMDWFFDEWVYGTEIPTYTMDATQSKKPDGTNTLNLKIVQSGVSDNFRMIVPVYFELDNGKIGRLGSVVMTGKQTLSQSIPLGQVSPKRFMLNYNYDVLSTN